MTSKINIEIDEKTLKALVLDYLNDKLGCDSDILLDDVKIETKSKQNYRSEWEIAAFRATVNKVIV